MANISHYDNPIQQQASEQLAFIENMILEGRKSTEYWGWNFVLWGIAYLVAMAWSSALTSSPSAYWAWPVTMTVTGFATALVARWRNKGRPQTGKSRAIVAIWMSVGFGIMTFAFPLIIAHRFADGHAFMGGIEILLGAAHLASGVITRWRMQVTVGALWWVAALVTEVSRGSLPLMVAFIAATLVCNIGFGAYLMVLEARDKARLRAGQVAHA